LYGVDKNPLAAEMAKLSLWLLTLAKDKPFEFLDHSIRCGDSLVGLHSIDQLRHYSLKPDADDAVLFKGPLDSAVDEAINLRLKLEDMPANSVDDVQRQEKLLIEANEMIARLRCAADMLVAAEFWSESAKDKLERVKYASNKSVELFEKGPTEEFEQVSAKERRGQSMFHWPLEFPEVIVKRGGFDAFVGNPPFVSGKTLGTILGEKYRDVLVDLLAHGIRGKRGQADICAYFFFRIFQLLAPRGAMGLVATNTIAQGDSRLVGLDQIDALEGKITQAVPTQRWPGTATLEIALVWITRMKWEGPVVLDGTTVAHITPYLSIGAEADGPPRSLACNRGISSEGIRVEGTGFVLTPEEHDHLVSVDPRNAEVIWPFLRGQDFNTRPDQSPAFSIINFQNWPLDRKTAPHGYVGPCASDYPDCLKIVLERVKPQRLALKPTSPFNISAATKWWQFCALRTEWIESLRHFEQILFHSFTSKYVAFGFVKRHCIWAAPHNVFALSGYDAFAVLQSSIHTAWALHNASTLRTDLRYTRSTCFETFVFPDKIVDVQSIGSRYYENRAALMKTADSGLTATYNRFHDPDETSADIQKLRDLHVEMDQAVSAAYGWTDLDLDHGFHETKQGVRFTISELARREVLQRLLKLNHERYAEEVKQGLHGKKGAAKKAAPKKAGASNPVKKEATLFDGEDKE
jgi:hypothetical protein